MLKMIDKKKVCFGLMIVLAIALLILLVILVLRAVNKPMEGNDYFSVESADWIGKDRNSDDDGDFRIDVHKATRGMGSFDGNKEQLYFYGNELMFFLHGFYKGNDFSEGYVEIIEGKEEYEADDILFSIGPQMDPDDGVIEGFILAKEENSTISFYIFIDNDWKEKMAYTNLMWGDDIHDPESFSVREFTFDESVSGIFVDKIIGIDWPIRDMDGAIFVGEVDIDMFSIKSQQDLGSSFMYVR